MANYDILGNIVIVKFDKKASSKEKKEFAVNFLKKYKSVRTVLEKTNKFSGRLRTQKTKYLLGEKTKEALYKENGCLFRLNVDSCYFSPRLSSERKEIATFVKKGENVLVLFGGVAPFAITIAKYSKVSKITSVELSKECNRYAEINVKLNKMQNRVRVIKSDVKKMSSKIKEKFDRIVMARPNLKDDFLKPAFEKIKKNGTIHYYGFYKEEDKDKIKELIEKEAKLAKKKVKILTIKKAGEIGVKKFRYRADIRLLN